MNRIREFRTARRWSSIQLAKRVGTSDATIRRLELGGMKLSESWMRRIAAALEVMPSDLLDDTKQPLPKPDVEPLLEADHPPTLRVLAQAGLKLVRIISDVVSENDLLPGEVAVVSEQPGHLANTSAGDVVLVEVGQDDDRRLLLRVLVPPKLLTTNRVGPNPTFRMGDPSLLPRIVGVVLRDATRPGRPETLSTG